MSKKEELLNSEQKTTEDQEFEYFDLNDMEKAQVQALAELVQQARLAQDVIYTNLVQSVAARHKLKGKVIDIDMDEVFKKGASEVKLRAKDEQKPDEDKALEQENLSGKEQSE
jgi:hypothetical protein